MSSIDTKNRIMAKPKNPRTPFAERLVKIVDMFESDHDLPTELGVSYTSLSEYQRGKSQPRGEFFERLQKLTGVNLNWLLTGEGLTFDEQTPKVPADAILKTDMQSKYIKPIVQRLARVQKDKDLHLEPDLVWWIVSSIHNALLEEHLGADVDTTEFDELLTELIDKQLEIAGW
jgi:transcriptional regulator with XRE-family HTH domain